MSRKALENTNEMCSIECFYARGIYANLLQQKKAFAQEKSSTPGGLFWDTNMAAVFFVLGHQYGRRDVMWKHSIWPPYRKKVYCYVRFLLA